MQEFLRAAKAAILRHGHTVTFIRVSTPVYNRFAGTSASTETTSTIKAYPRQVVANQYNSPNMIGKELIEFYIYAPDIASIAPKPNDRITFSGADYTIFQVREHRADTAVLLYKALAVKT